MIWMRICQGMTAMSQAGLQQQIKLEHSFETLFVEAPTPANGGQTV
jgi:hypothetical protein